MLSSSIKPIFWGQISKRETLLYSGIYYKVLYKNGNIINYSVYQYPEKEYPVIIEDSENYIEKKIPSRFLYIHSKIKDVHFLYDRKGKLLKVKHHFLVNLEDYTINIAQDNYTFSNNDNIYYYEYTNEGLKVWKNNLKCILKQEENCLHYKLFCSDSIVEQVFFYQNDSFDIISVIHIKNGKEEIWWKQDNE